jgi:hypothetical protein
MEKKLMTLLYQIKITCVNPHAQEGEMKRGEEMDRGRDGETKRQRERERERISLCVII